MRLLIVAIFAIQIPVAVMAATTCPDNQYSCGPGICCPK